VKILESKKINFNIKNYLIENLSKKELTHIFKLLKLKPKDLLRTKEREFIALDLSEKELNNDDIVIDYIIKYPKILERPIVLSNNHAVVGRPPEKVLEIL